MRRRGCRFGCRCFGLAALLALCCGVVFPAAAQERNMARLTASDTTYVDVSMGVSGETGQLKDLFAPEQVLRGRLDAASRQKLGQVSLYGHFGYGYDYGWGSTWRGWIDPYETPFMLADSIPGSLSLERYALQAGAGLPLGGGWALGLDLAYDVALMAKHKDLRNKNTGMTFRVSPGLYWRGARAGLGLNAGYERATERVEYMQVSDNVEHVLFDLYGLWLCHANGFASAENRRMKENDRFFGNFQLDLSLGAVEVHNDLGLSWMQSLQTEVGYNNQQFGEVRSWRWDDHLSIGIGAAHAVEASATYSTMVGARPLQRQELDPDSRIRRWVTYGQPVYGYWRQYHAEELRYTYGTSWKLTAGVSNWFVKHGYVEYPQQFFQWIGAVTPFVATAVPLGPQWSVEASAGFAKTYDSHSEVTEWQLAAPMSLQWAYWAADRWLAGAGLNWRAASGRTYLRARYDVELSPERPAALATASGGPGDPGAASALAGGSGGGTSGSGPAPGGARHAASLTVGFLF